MIRGIDHLVIACADPAAAATELESALGLAVGGGGRHDGLRTFNRIVWLADGSYLELIGDAVPFLIQHAYVGAEWGHAALAERATFRHPLGSPVILTRLDLATGDPPSVAATIHERLEIDFWAVADLAVADIGLHVIRLVPRREMAVPAVVTLAAEVDSARTVELLGLRFNIERAELPVSAASVDG
ncbi:MAG: VOC family protein [Candidatus Limnocylindria bacterium]